MVSDNDKNDNKATQNTSFMDENRTQTNKKPSPYAVPDFGCHNRPSTLEYRLHD